VIDARVQVDITVLMTPLQTEPSGAGRDAATAGGEDDEDIRVAAALKSHGSPFSRGMLSRRRYRCALAPSLLPLVFSRRYFVALRCVALRCVALRCVALRCVALRCVALRCVALRCVVVVRRYTPARRHLVAASLLVGAAPVAPVACLWMRGRKQRSRLGGRRWRASGSGSVRTLAWYRPCVVLRRPPVSLRHRRPVV
jgi:hypothetical protein